MTVAVIGAGAFGTALAIALCSTGGAVLWGRNVGWAQGEARENPHLPGVTLPPALHVTGDIGQAVSANTILLAIPAQKLAGFLEAHAARLNGKRLVSTAKGIDARSLTGPSHLLATACPDATVAVLTGPSFAADIARGLPTALTLACQDPALGEELQARLSGPALRLYRTTDVIGAETGGALKNVIAIAAGAAVGAGLGESARAAIITRGFSEMLRIATRLGARPETLSGLSGLGDLILTCTSSQSRNFHFGRSLGAGEMFDPATTVEGAATAKAIAALARKLGEDLPILEMVASLAEGRVSVDNAMEYLLNRPLKEE